MIFGAGILKGWWDYPFRKHDFSHLSTQPPAVPRNPVMAYGFFTAPFNHHRHHHHHHLITTFVMAVLSRNTETQQGLAINNVKHSPYN